MNELSSCTCSITYQYFIVANLDLRHGHPHDLVYKQECCSAASTRGCRFRSWKRAGPASEEAHPRRACARRSKVHASKIAWNATDRQRSLPDRGSFYIPNSSLPVSLSLPLPKWRDPDASSVRAGRIGLARPRPRLCPPWASCAQRAARNPASSFTSGIPRDAGSGRAAIAGILDHRA